MNIKMFKSSINDVEFTSVLDFMQSFSADYDMIKVAALYESVKPVLSTALLDHYETRHKHHIECLIDGIVKERCLRDGSYDYTATEEDYHKLKFVWQKVIASWIPVRNIMKMTLSERIDYMPEKCQYLFWTIAKESKPMIRGEIEQLVIDELTRKEVYESLLILMEKEILLEDNNMNIITYFKNRDLTENELCKANTLIKFMPKK